MTGNVLAIVLLQKTVLMAVCSRKRYRLRLLEFLLSAGREISSCYFYMQF